jgi:hypothetical protein
MLHNLSMPGELSCDEQSITGVPDSSAASESLVMGDGARVHDGPLFHGRDPWFAT